MELFKRLERKLDLMLEAASALGEMKEELEEIRRTLDLLRAPSPELDLTNGLSSIMSYDGRGKRNE